MTFRLFGGVKIDDRMRTQSRAVIQSQSVASWSEADVVVWLDDAGFKDCCK